MKKDNRTLLIVIVYIVIVSALLIDLYKMRPGVESTIGSIILLTWAVIVTKIFFEAEEWRPPETATAEEVKKWKDDKNTGLFKLQYEQMNAQIRGRDNLTIIAGSIMVTASLFLLGTLIELESIQTVDLMAKALMISTIMGIYSIWFLCFNLTSKRLNTLQLERLNKMEDAREFRLHAFNIEQVRNEKWWLYGRRPVWLYFFYVLTIASILSFLM